MIDLNNTNHIDRIISIAQSKNGKAIRDFFKEQIKTLDYASIDANQSLEKIGADFLAIHKSRVFIEKLVNLLTPEKGD